MRKQFDIKYRPQIESGEYKVETRDGRKARIIHWDLNCTSPIVAVMDAHIDLPGEIVDVFSVSGRAFDDLESPSDLFLVTPEEEMTEFEKKLWEVLKSEGSPIGPIEKFTDDDKRVFHAYAAKLLAIARKELEPEVLERLEVAYKNQDEVVYENGKRDGKAEALKDLPRWKKLTAGEMADVAIMAHCIVKCDYFLTEKDLEKLPGFNE